MADTNFLRAVWAQTVVIDDSATTSSAVDVGDASFGLLQVPSGFEGTSVTYTVATTTGGTYYPLYDGVGAAISTSVSAGQSVALPPELFGARSFKVVASAQTGAITLTVSLKG